MADTKCSSVHSDLAQELFRFAMRLSHVAPGVDLERSASAILCVLSDGSPRTLKQMSIELELEQSTVNRQVNSAIRSGYVERFEMRGFVPKMIRPTEFGREMFRRDSVLCAEQLEKVFAKLTPATNQALLREVAAFNDAYLRNLHRHSDVKEDKSIVGRTS